MFGFLRIWLVTRSLADTTARNCDMLCAAADESPIAVTSATTLDPRMSFVLSDMPCRLGPAVLFIRALPKAESPITSLCQALPVVPCQALLLTAPCQALMTAALRSGRIFLRADGRRNPAPCSPARPDGWR